MAQPCRRGTGTGSLAARWGALWALALAACAGAGALDGEPAGPTAPARVDAGAGQPARAASRGAGAPARAGGAPAVPLLVDAGTCTGESDAELCARAHAGCGRLDTPDRCGQQRHIASCGECAPGLVCAPEGARCIPACPRGMRPCCDGQCGTPLECAQIACDPAPRLPVEPR